MTRLYALNAITFRQTFLDDAGEPADPGQVRFHYAIGREGPREVATPVSEGQGVFSVTFTPKYSGHLYGQWEGDGNVPDQAYPVTAQLFDSAGVRS